MRQWRIGSFSMGLILMLLGVGLIIDRFSTTPKAIDLIITWWPLALILLGIEIVAGGILSRNEQFKLKYDGWSIFLMIVFLFFSLGSYALLYSGVIPQLQEALSISAHSCSIPDQEIDLAGIRKVTISSRDGGLELHSLTGEKLTILGQAKIQASSIEAAEEMAKLAQAEINKVGDILYIRINSAPGEGNIFRSNYGGSARTIFLPAQIPLEVNCRGFDSAVTMGLDSLEAPWSIDSAGPVTVNLAPDLDLTLTGRVDWSRENLTGNADWIFTADPDSEENHHGASGVIKLGKGRRTLNIFSNQQIEVNIRPDL